MSVAASLRDCRPCTASGMHAVAGQRQAGTFRWGSLRQGGSQPLPQYDFRRRSSGQRSRGRTCLALSSYADDGASASQGDPKAKHLLEYVQDVQPHIMEQFANQSSPEVVDAMRLTVTNMLGTLPPQIFEVSITSSGENLAQLMLSLLLTGYMFRNVQYRLELRKMFHRPAGEMEPVGALPSLLDRAGDYAEGTQTSRVQGEVLRWHHASGMEAIPAAEYIGSLECENAMLRQQLESVMRVRPQGNAVLSYLKQLDSSGLQELTDRASDPVLEAMNSFIYRLLGSRDEETLRMKPSTSNANEMARLLYWLLVVGYTLRQLELRFEVENPLILPDSAPSS